MPKTDHLTLEKASAQVVETTIARNSPLKTPVIQMIIFNQGMLLLGSDHSLIENWGYYLRCRQTKFCHRRAS